MRPSSGSVNPAMESSSVVFPAPDAPKRIVKPASARKWTFRLKLPSGFGKRLRMRTSRSAEIAVGEGGVADGDAPVIADFIATGQPPRDAGSRRRRSTTQQTK